MPRSAESALFADYAFLLMYSHFVFYGFTQLIGVFGDWLVVKWGSVGITQVVEEAQLRLAIVWI